MSEKEKMMYYIRELKNNSQVFVPVRDSLTFIMYVLILGGRKFYDCIRSEKCKTENVELNCYYYENC